MTKRYLASYSLIVFMTGFKNMCMFFGFLSIKCIISKLLYIQRKKVTLTFSLLFKVDPT